MKYFIVEGKILDAEKMTNEIMESHMKYTQKAMDEGLILMSGLKTDMTGGIFLIKAESEEIVQTYLDNEPFKLHEIQEYRIIKFSAHYFNENIHDWFDDDFLMS